MATRPYRPSNGSEGLDFEEAFCSRCKRDEEYRRTEDGSKGCQILARTFAYAINDPKYPTEWVQDEDGARCTAFEPMDKPEGA